MNPSRRCTQWLNVAGGSTNGKRENMTRTTPSNSQSMFGLERLKEGLWPSRNFPKTRGWKHPNHIAARNTPRVHKPRDNPTWHLRSAENDTLPPFMHWGKKIRSEIFLVAKQNPPEIDCKVENFTALGLWFWCDSPWMAMGIMKQCKWPKRGWCICGVTCPEHCRRERRCWRRWWLGLRRRGIPGKMFAVVVVDSPWLSLVLYLFPNSLLSLVAGFFFCFFCFWKFPLAFCLNFLFCLFNFRIKLILSGNFCSWGSESKELLASSLHLFCFFLCRLVAWNENFDFLDLFSHFPVNGVWNSVALSSHWCFAQWSLYCFVWFFCNWSVTRRIVWEVSICLLSFHC